MKPEYCSTKKILHWQTDEWDPISVAETYIVQHGAKLAYPDREDIQNIISDLRAFAVAALQVEYHHSISIDIDTYVSKIPSAGLSIPITEYNEQHVHYRDENYSPDVGFFQPPVEKHTLRRTVFTLDMGNNRNHQFQSVVFQSREVIKSGGMAEELLKPEARLHLHSFFAIFPADAEYALMTNNDANLIVAKYGDFSAALVV